MINRIRLLTVLGLLLLTAQMVHSQAYDAMRRITSFDTNALIAVQTNSFGAAGQKFLTAIDPVNFLESLMDLPNWTGGGGGSGESNFLSSASTTNGTRFELPYDKTGTTNRVKTLEMGYGMAGTNQSTNLVVAVDAATIPSHTQVNAASNAVLNLAFTNANQVWSNVIVVNPTGNVLTNGILLTNAVKYAGTLASASRPVLVRIMPGTYGTPTNTLPSVMWAVDNVSTYWEPGAVWWSGTAGGDAAWMFDDQTAARTNCYVYGRGRFFITNDSINVFYTDKESRIRFECLSMYVTDGVGGNSTASPFTWGSVTNDLDVEVHDYMESADYDAFYGALAAGQRLRLKAKTVRAVGDIFEFGDDSPQWGNVILDIDRAEQTATTGQASFLQMAGRVHARIGQIQVASTVSSMAANGAINGILQGAIIELPANGTRSVIQDSSGGSWHTGLWLRDCVLIGPTNVDALTLTNIATVPTILENTTIRPGWASTNWARGATPSNVKIVGGFNLDPYKPLGSQVTVISTNYLPSIRNIGTLVQHGASYFSNDVTVAGWSVYVWDGDVYGRLAYFDGIQATNSFIIPNGAGPYTPAEGEIMFDNNYWAAGRGALVTWDGTANVVTPMALQSDTPSNGQVLKFNTGGTFTWEDDNNSGGSGGNTTNTHSLNISNHFSLSFTNVGSNSIQGFDFMGPSVADSFINGDTTWNFTNLVAWTNMQGGTVSPRYEINARYGSGTLTLASLHPIDFGDGGLFLAAGATNTVVIQYINGRLMGSVSHRASTGSGPIVLQTNATIYLGQLETNTFLMTGVGGQVTTGTVDTATLSMSSGGVLSARGLSVGTNGGTLAYVTNLVFRSGVVISNDATGIASVHLAASSGTSRGIISFDADIATTIADATTYYVGKNNGTNLRTTFSDVSQYIPYDCTVTRVVLHIFCTTGSNENMVVNVTDGTNDSSTWNVSIVNGRETYDSGAISYAVTAGEELAVEILTPTWVTNPTIVFVTADVYVTF